MSDGKDDDRLEAKEGDMTTRQARVGLLSVLVLLTAFTASATLVITGDFVFTENCGPNL